MTTTGQDNEIASTMANHAQQAADAAQTRAGAVADQASAAAQDVMGTATKQAQQVKDETVRQARNLAAEASGQMTSQAREQTQRLTGNLRDLGDELRTMAEAGQPGHTATELVHQASERAHRFAGYLDGREPEEILDDLRSYARRRPGTFLLGAAVAGMVAARAGRALKDAHGDETSRSGPASPVTSPPTTRPPTEIVLDRSDDWVSATADDAIDPVKPVWSAQPDGNERLGGGL